MLIRQEFDEKFREAGGKPGGMNRNTGIAAELLILTVRLRIGKLYEI